MLVSPGRSRPARRVPPTDNAWVVVLPRRLAMIVLAVAAALAESPHVASAFAARLRALTVCLLVGTAVAGVVVGPFGLQASWQRRARVDQSPVCAETLTTVLACATDDDARRPW